MSHDLCKPCSDLAGGGKWSEWPLWKNCGNYPLFVHHESLQSLAQCAMRGSCSVCMVLDHHVRERVIRGWDRSPVLFYSSARQGIRFQVVLDMARDMPLTVSEFYLCPEEEFVRLLRPVSIPMERNTFSEASKRYIRASLEACETSHKNCSALAVSQGFLPNRLVDVGSRPRSHVRVVLTSRMTGQKYATLSHCWGKNKSLCLTKESNQQLAQGVDGPVLPLTFQHAMDVARFLGLKYLWIDSLCIMQDSEEDWRTESSLMSEVYRHSWVTIAATAAADSQGGLFFDRDSTDLVSIQPLPLKLESGSEGPGIDNCPPGDYFLADAHTITSLDGSPLNRRGWVLQERLLSLRIIHFSGKQVHWECVESMSCEGISNLQHKALYSGSGREIRDILHGSKVTTPRTLQGEIPGPDVSSNWYSNFFVFWGHFVRQYTRCGLTEDRDKLVAIHGIVKELEKKLGDKFFAGHWMAQLPASLCWYVPISGSWSDAVEVRRPRQWRAPLWSWAALNMPIVHLMPIVNNSRISKLVQVSAPQHSNGELISGRIRLEGSLFTANLTPTCQGDSCSRVENSVAKYLSHLGIGDSEGVTICNARIFQDDYTSRTKFLLMPITCSEHRSQDSGCSVYCLILIPTDLERGVFLRRGFVMLRLWDSYENIFSGIQQPRDSLLECGSAWNENVIEII